MVSGEVCRLLRNSNQITVTSPSAATVLVVPVLGHIGMVVLAAEERREEL